MTILVALLCSLTSLACAILLMRGFRRSGAPLLRWSGLCFAGLALSNAMYIVDFQVVAQHDLSLVRIAISLVAVSVLLYGMVTESK